MTKGERDKNTSYLPIPGDKRCVDVKTWVDGRSVARVCLPLLSDDMI